MIGQPSSHGCIRLRNTNMMELFDMACGGDPLEIHSATGSPDG